MERCAKCGGEMSLAYSAKKQTGKPYALKCTTPGCGRKIMLSAKEARELKGSPRGPSQEVPAVPAPQASAAAAPAADAAGEPDVPAKPRGLFVHEAW
jgi:DNA-directed RNA polymerase subunit RPC12/RpoP